MKPTQEESGGAAIEAAANALSQVFHEMYGITWVCEDSHRFGQAQVRSPTQCSVCKTPLIKPEMARRTGPVKKKEPFKLSGLEQEALARIS